MRKWRERTKAIAKKAWNERQKVRQTKGLWQRIREFRKNAQPMTSWEYFWDLTFSSLLLLAIPTIYILNLYIKDLRLSRRAELISQLWDTVGQWLQQHLSNFS